MGGGSWSADVYANVVTSRTSSGKDTFAYDASVKATGTLVVHEKLDPKGVKMRESRDSVEHPNSVAVSVWLDVTGSMNAVVRGIHANMPKLMGLLTRKGYLTDPQVKFGAIGDATCDAVPLQVGQFESDVRMEADLSNVVLEGGGGGQNTESYELAAYFDAYHTSIDCYEKRGKRGYCFIIGDELAYPNVDQYQVQRLIGDNLEANMRTDAVFAKLAEMYNVFYVVPVAANNGRDKRIIESWKNLVGGENVLLLEKAEGIAELIAAQIGLCEGAVDVDKATEDLKENNTSTAIVSAVMNAVSKSYANSGSSLAKVTGGSLAPHSSSKARRL